MAALAIAQGQDLSSIDFPAPPEVPSAPVPIVQNNAPVIINSNVVPASPVQQIQEEVLVVPQTPIHSPSLVADTVGSVPSLIFIHPYIPPQTTTETYVPQPGAIKDVSNLIGSLAEGNIVGVASNAIRLAGTEVVQNTAKLAAAGVIHSGVSWFNCQVLRNCNRPNIV